MDTRQEPTYSAFAGDRRIVSGPLEEMLRRTWHRLHSGRSETVLIFDDQTGSQVDFDFRGGVDEVVARAQGPRGGAAPARGRPRLGVVSREVTLLPRHWEWLERQPNGISAALRRLVDEARKREPEKERARQARDAAGRFMTAMAGDRPGYEEASRALFAGDRKRLEQLMRPWPRDVRAHVERLLSTGLAWLAVLTLASVLASAVSAQDTQRASEPATPGTSRGDACQARDGTRWARGFEGQRKADLGDGCYLNPILAGDHPDPSVLKDGDDYYMTFSSFDAYPGLVVWRSRDLVNWQPVGPALFRNVGSVWAPDLVKHGGRFYIYFPARTASYRSNYVVWADRISGPWSEPIDLKLPLIDPGHAVGEDGRRYLFLSGGRYVPLSEDGLATAGEVKHAYEGWKYPDDWIVESFSQEGPKILKHGEYFHMILAEGGTAGPPTGHMIVSARSRSIHGPWENSPHNPIARTLSAAERWWSKGHGTLVEGPDGRWYIVYHSYENGFLTLGRQTLLEPVEWTADGWVRLAGRDPARPIRKPADTAGAVHGFAFSGGFSPERMGVQWSFYDGGLDEAGRYRIEDGALVLKGKGSSPQDASPLWFVAGDPAYELEVEIETDGRAAAGLLVFYSRRLYGGLGFDDESLILHRYGLDRRGPKPQSLGRRVFLRMVNERNLVSLYYSADGRGWTRYDTRMDVSGYHHNTAYDFLSLRPALYAAGSGEARFRGFRYRALP